MIPSSPLPAPGTPIPAIGKQQSTLPPPILNGKDASGKNSSIEPQKQPDSPTPPQSKTICSRIADFFRMIWEFLFGEPEEEPSQIGQNGTKPPAAPANGKTNATTNGKKRRRAPRTTAGTPVENPTRPQFQAPQQAPRVPGEPLKLYNFGPHASANVCWLNSLSQIILNDKDLLDATVIAFRADGHTELADHFLALYGSENGYARVNSDLLFNALIGTNAEETILENAQNDPGEAFQSLTSTRSAASLLLLPIISDLINLADDGKLQNGSSVNPEDLTRIVARRLQIDGDDHRHWPPEAQWPPVHLLLHLARATRTPAPAMAFRLPALLPGETVEQTRISIRKTLELLDGETGTTFQNKTAARDILETILQEGLSLAALRLQLDEISTLGDELNRYAESTDTSGTRKFTENSHACAHLKRTAYLLKEILGCNYKKTELTTLVEQIETLLDLCAKRKEMLQTIADDFARQPLSTALPRTNAGQLNYRQIFYEQLRGVLSQLVSQDGEHGELRQAVQVETEERRTADSVPLLSLLYTQFHRPTHPDRNTRPDVVGHIIAGPSTVWDQARELLNRAVQELTHLTVKEQQALDGVRKFVNDLPCRSFSYVRENAPPLPRFHMPSQTSYTINGEEYELKGVVKHSNSSGEGGHYTAVVPGFYCNDTSITPISNEEFQRRISSGGDVILHLKKKKKD